MCSRVFVQIGLPVILLASLVYANGEGPPNARTGAPGEPTCLDCHFGNALNIPGGAVSLTVPATFRPFDTLTIDINLQRESQSRWGFELTVIDGDSNAVGRFIFTDTIRMQLGTGLTGRQYAKHRLAGTDRGIPDIAPGWSIDWQAPALSVGDVTFYAAGNAANNNGFQTGDFIYTTSATTMEINQGPTIMLVGPQTVVTGGQLQFTVTATDPDNTLPILSASQLPVNATFVDNADGSGLFTFDPDFTQVGEFQVTFQALDGTITDSGTVAITVESCCVGSTGNVDNGANGVTDIADLTFLIDNLFINFTALPCPSEANIDGDASGVVDIADLTFLIDNLFINFTPTAACQ